MSEGGSNLDNGCRIGEGNEGDAGFIGDWGRDSTGREYGEDVRFDKGYPER